AVNRWPYLSMRSQPFQSLKKRTYFIGTAFTATYLSASIILWEAWYKDIGISRFHFFNDWKGWERMDKYGHLFTAYNESNWSMQGLQWAGVNRRKAMWIGAAIGTGLQLTIEVMDGFGEDWGFSVSDVAFNTLGVGLFVGQELLWEEQRITFKVSSNARSYPDLPVYSRDGQHSITISERAADLFGESYTERFLKDYNAQTLWASFNIHSFLPPGHRRFPKWLNVAVGYGAENMFEGDDDRYGWSSLSANGTPIEFDRDPTVLPRYQQFYLSLDVDLRRIPTKSPFLKTVFNILNFIKIPAPALELNTQGQFRAHWIR
ncbi:MAG: DUF2279 domain-containing protein, partial [Bacteroidota bacterium]